MILYACTRYTSSTHFLEYFKHFRLKWKIPQNSIGENRKMLLGLRFTLLFSDLILRKKKHKFILLFIIKNTQSVTTGNSENSKNNSNKRL